MVVGIHRRAVGVFSHRRDAEAALHELRDAGFAMDRVSVVVRDADRNDQIAGAEVILRRRGIEEFEVYDIPVGTANYTATPSRDLGVTHKHAIGYFSRLEDAEAAINDLRAAGFPLSQISLIHRDWSRRDRFAGVTLRDRFDDAIHNLKLRLPDHRARFYNERFHNGDYVVVVSGTDADIQHAAAILNRHGIQQWEIFEPTATDYVATPRREVVSTPVSGYGTTPLHRNRRAIGVFAHLVLDSQLMVELVAFH